MATKIPNAARLGFSLKTGTNPLSGADLKTSVSLGHIMPGCDIQELGAVATAVSSLFVAPTLKVSLVETSFIV